MGKKEDVKAKGERGMNSKTVKKGDPMQCGFRECLLLH